MQNHSNQSDLQHIILCVCECMGVYGHDYYARSTRIRKTHFNSFPIKIESLKLLNVCRWLNRSSSAKCVCCMYGPNTRFRWMMWYMHVLELSAQLYLHKYVHFGRHIIYLRAKPIPRVARARSRKYPRFGFACALMANVGDDDDIYFQMNDRTKRPNARLKSPVVVSIYGRRILNVQRR